MKRSNKRKRKPRPRCKHSTVSRYEIKMDGNSLTEKLFRALYPRTKLNIWRCIRCRWQFLPALNRGRE